ncbi:MAG: hypothetical protein SCH71_07260 [Desulfobulbaceae bacterium]|nr:hypothetical protein [Desulfobulbaceae bacterium]
MLLIDAHVHIYNCFDPAALFSAAARNFRIRARRMGVETSSSFILLLTEKQEDNRFAALSGEASDIGGPGSGPESWQISMTAEKECLVLTGNDHDKIFLIAGRQTVSREGLEVLALLTGAEFDDGLPASSLIKKIRDAGGVPVIPWAFGKWSGVRGRVLRRLLEMSGDDFFLGDNGGRPSCLPVPGLLRREKERGRAVISGSDPLPLPGEESRVGSFGIYVDAGLDAAAPVRQLKSLLAGTSSRFRSYGDPMPFFRFARNQCLLRRVKTTRG